MTYLKFRLPNLQNKTRQSRGASCSSKSLMPRPLLSWKQRWDTNGHLLILTEEISVVLVICLRWGEPAILLCGH